MLILLLFKKMDKKESTKKYYYDVIPSYNIKGTLLYSSDIKYEIGSIIRISLRKKEVLGCVFDILKKKPHINFKIKDILKKEYQYKFNKNIIDFILWVSEYTACNVGLILKLIIPNDKFLEIKTKNFLRENQNYTFKLTEKQKTFLNFILKNNISDKEIINQGFYKKNFIDSLVKKKISI